MENPHAEEIELRVRFSDLAALEGEEAEAVGDEDDIEFEIHAPVVRLGPDRFRIAEPFSLSPFGPHGPMLDMGDIIIATPLDDGKYRYVRRVDQARVWTVTVSAREVARRLETPVDDDATEASSRTLNEVLRRGEAGRILDAIEAAGGAWEYCVGNLTIQVPLADGQSEPPVRVRELVGRLPEVLGSA